MSARVWRFPASWQRDRASKAGMYKVGAIFFAAAFAAASGLSGALLAATPARAESCPGNPNALGTSRVLAIKFGDYTRLGRMQYPQTLPLADKEVVITFDDGPQPLLSDRVLDILASQCVKVTYFLIGEMAHYYPALVRREYEAGHTIGTHSQDHPLRFDKLTDAQVQQEIDQGIASVGAALGDPNDAGAVLPHPRARPHGHGRTRTRRAIAHRLQRRRCSRRLAPPHHAGPDHPTCDEPPRKERQGNSLAPRHPSGDGARAPRTACGVEGEGFSDRPRRARRTGDGRRPESMDAGLGVPEAGLIDDGAGRADMAAIRSERHARR